MRAIRIEGQGENQARFLEHVEVPALETGHVQVKILYSSLNYKDALGVCGKGKIYKRFPIIGGIDLAGHVEQSSDPQLSSGDEVLVTGCGLGEWINGGFAEIAQVPAECVVRCPQGLNSKTAMIFGTAGFTAALSIHRMIVNGQEPSKGPILVTGASGGVGSFSVWMLSRLGYPVSALTGKPEMAGYLKSLGASEVLSMEELQLSDKPLESAKWGGVVDNLGGPLLGRLLSQVQPWGNVTSIGLAQGAEFRSTVMPFILRGVNLLGISSNNCPTALRIAIWQNLSKEYANESLSAIHQEEIGLPEVIEASRRMLNRKTHGRIVVKCN
jgi:NADPH2:quinone reductase